MARNTQLNSAGAVSFTSYLETIALSLQMWQHTYRKWFSKWAAFSTFSQLEWIKMSVMSWKGLPRYQKGIWKTLWTVNVQAIQIEPSNTSHCLKTVSCQSWNLELVIFKEYFVLIRRFKAKFGLDIINDSEFLDVNKVFGAKWWSTLK